MDRLRAGEGAGRDQSKLTRASPKLRSQWNGRLSCSQWRRRPTCSTQRALGCHVEREIREIREIPPPLPPPPSPPPSPPPPSPPPSHRRPRRRHRPVGPDYVSILGDPEKGERSSLSGYWLGPPLIRPCVRPTFLPLRDARLRAPLRPAPGASADDAAPNHLSIRHRPARAFRRAF